MDATQIANGSVTTGHVEIDGQIRVTTDGPLLDTSISVQNQPVDAEEPGSPKDPQMQLLFDKTVCEELQLPYQYQVVNVLIIRWAEYLDRDLKCGDEVKELKDVFKNQYHFNTEVLTLHDKKSPQFQLNTGINNFVVRHDGPPRTHLLIIYYTGHGSGLADGLWISGVRDPTASAIGPRHKAEAHWVKAEEGLLEHAEADILAIMDTCSAGTVVKGAMDDIRTFEVLAAAPKKMVTAAPGRRSFSRAMINALKEQLTTPENLPFTTFDLNNKIIRMRDIQHSQVYPRLNSQSHRFIKLAPLNCSIKPQEPEPAPKEASHLTLRFTFEHMTYPSREETEKLAKYLSKAALESKLGINRIEWVKFVKNDKSSRLVEMVMLYRAVFKAQRLWRDRLRKRSMLKRQREDDEGEEVEGHHPKRIREQQPLTPNSNAHRSNHPSPA